MHPISTLPLRQRAHEPARFAAILTMGILLATYMGSTVSAQDAYGGITGPNYPNPYPQSGTYFGNTPSPTDADVPPRRSARWRRPNARW